MKVHLALKKLPVGIQDFVDLRTNDYVYVDKTEYLYQLITTGKVYFLSRPRRFGKSLTISTLEAIFQAKRFSFDGLWIKEKSDYDWQPYPVIRIDMTKTDFTSVESFNQSLIELLEGFAKTYEVDISTDGKAAQVLNRLIDVLAKTYVNVVVLDGISKS